MSAIITRSLTKKAQTERKQAKETYGHDKISRKARCKVKTSKVAYSQVSKDVAKSASRNPSAWQNRFVLLSSDDESSDLETSKNHTQTRNMEASEVQTAKKRKTTKKNQRRAENKRNKKNILIIGDSIVKHLDGRKLKGSLRYEQNVYFKSFSGANVHGRLARHGRLLKTTNEKNPNIVVLHVGTNSLGTNKPAEEIATEIYLAADLRNGVNEVVVSAIISRGDDSMLNTKAKTVNEKLKTLCGENSLDLIEHQNINATKHLNGSALHLNRMGTVLLANNLIKYLKAQ